MSGPFIVYLDTPMRFKNRFFLKAWDRWQKARGHWCKVWETKAVTALGSMVSRYEPEVERMTVATMPVAIEFINARREYIRTIKMIPREQNNTHFTKYVKRTPLRERCYAR